jgi:hypothetical protein
MKKEEHLWLEGFPDTVHNVEPQNDPSPSREVLRETIRPCRAFSVDIHLRIAPFSPEQLSQPNLVE